MAVHYSDGYSKTEGLRLTRYQGVMVVCTSGGHALRAHLDVSLPKLTGLDLQKLVAADRTTMPIIFITAYGTVPMSVEAMKAGASEFLTKPFGDEVLLTAIRIALEHSEDALR